MRQQVASENNPWAAIDSKATIGELRARRIDSSHPHSFFWALNSEGRKLLVLESKNGFSTTCELPSLRGIAITLSEGRLVLRLQDVTSVEIFVALCRNIVARTQIAMTDEELLNATLEQLFKWQAFLSKPNSGLLNDSELRGLIGELYFIYSQLIPRFGDKSINFWLGPSGAPQDFSIGREVFEVKTKLAGSSDVIRISSIEQLWVTDANLYLVHYTIGETIESDALSVSAPSLIENIRGMLQNQETVDRFDDQLLLFGYVDHPVYRRRLFRLSSPRYYKVRDGFPRLSMNLPLGITAVNYGIELSACLPFESEPEWN
ncbi:PD-(D/E)XK motif protein [Pseudoduganella sp.]|uniref:PD-(D/E)XK motif protein n=1 Tax=Pseudoduganella sp. TaxID=1880898 RepID=UPI0035B08B66